MMKPDDLALGAVHRIVCYNRILAFRRNKIQKYGNIGGKGA